MLETEAGIVCHHTVVCCRDVVHHLVGVTMRIICQPDIQYRHTRQSHECVCNILAEQEDKRDFGVVQAQRTYAQVLAYSYNFIHTHVFIIVEQRLSGFHPRVFLHHIAADDICESVSREEVASLNDPDAHCGEEIAVNGQHPDQHAPVVGERLQAPLHITVLVAEAEA